MRIIYMVMQYLSLFQLNDDYSLAPDKTEIKRKMFSNYQFMITDFYNILMGNVKRLVSNFFDKEKHVLHYENVQLYLRLRLKLKQYITY